MGGDGTVSVAEDAGRALIKVPLLPLHYSPPVSLFYKAFIEILIIYITVAVPCAVLPPSFILIQQGKAGGPAGVNRYHAPAPLTRCQSHKQVQRAAAVQHPRARQVERLLLTERAETPGLPAAPGGHRGNYVTALSPERQKNMSTRCTLDIRGSF